MGDPNHPAVVPVCVVTGFLGSGKTTFVRHALREAGRAGVRAAALVNDVADFNVDDEILQTDAPSATTGRKRTVKLSNGCVCCSIRDNLLIALVSGCICARNDAHIRLLTDATAIRSRPIPAR